MKTGDVVSVSGAVRGTFLHEVTQDRVTVEVDGANVTVPRQWVITGEPQVGDILATAEQLRALPSGAVVAHGHAVNVARGNGTFTFILNGEVARTPYSAWMLHRPCRLVHLPNS